jgi:hypothetical protein
VSALSRVQLLEAEAQALLRGRDACQPTHALLELRHRLAAPAIHPVVIACDDPHMHSAAALSAIGPAAGHLS